MSSEIEGDRDGRRESDGRIGGRWEEEEEEAEEEEEVAPKKAVKKPLAPAPKKKAPVVEEETEEEEMEELAEEVEEEEEETPAPKKPTIGSKKPVVAAKTAVPVKKVAAPKKDVVAKAPKGEAFSSDNQEHVDMLAPFVELFPEDKFEFKILKRGFTAFALLKSAKKAIVSVDRLSIVDGVLVGDLFFNALKGQEEVTKHVGDHDKGFKQFNNNLIFIPKLTQEEIMEVMNDELMKVMMTKLQVIDKRLAANKEKLEEKIKGEEPKKAVATAPGTVVKKKTIVLAKKK